MDYNALFAAHRDDLEDFWGRRDNEPRFTRPFHLFGRPFQLSSNHQDVLAAVDHCLPLYSVASPTDDPPFSIQLVVQAGPTDPVPAPNTLFDYIQYTGNADWLMIHLGAWGHCHVGLTSGQAKAVLTPALAERPDLVSLCLLNTVFTNFFIAHGFAMLHTSCLVQDGRALLLMAPHNSGKSTTALRLALAGYPLLSDSMVFLTRRGDQIQLLGFPVGKVKLRRDVLHEFPQLRRLLTPEYVRHETKYSLDLRQLDSRLVYSRAFVPSRTELCLLTQGEEACLKPASRTDALNAVMANSLFYDTAAVWRRNLALIGQLLEHTRTHHLTIGPDGGETVSAVATLWETRAQ